MKKLLMAMLATALAAMLATTALCEGIAEEPATSEAWEDAVRELDAFELPAPEDGPDLPEDGGAMPDADFPAEVHTYRTSAAGDGDALFAGYVDRLFGVGGPEVAAPVGDLLAGHDGALYRYMKEKVLEIAAGARAETAFDVPVEALGLEQTSWTAKELGVTGVQAMFQAAREKLYCNFPLVLDTLMFDCPYELFWFDKSDLFSYTDWQMTLRDDRISVAGPAKVAMPVAAEFAADRYAVDAARLQSVHAAAQNARAVVDELAGGTDYDKLHSYALRICALTDYNREAAAGGEGYGNPWQLIWVFDGDPATKVVCEGYSKAFKYLCDMSAFSAGVGCYLATGYLLHDSGYGNHMWNLVTMENNRSYLVDVTTMDSDDGDYDEALFLAGQDGLGEYGEYLIVGGEYHGMMGYLYGEECRSVLPEHLLELSELDYLADSREPDPAPVPQPQSLALNVKKATLGVGQKMTIGATVAPADADAGLTFSSSKPSVAKVNAKGVVTAKKKGSATIIVSTGNGLFETVSVKVGAKPTKVKLNKTGAVTLKKGKTLKLKVVLSPSGAVGNVTWKSSRPKVASVSASGKVTAKKKGTTVITVKTWNGKKASVKVKVK